MKFEYGQIKGGTVGAENNAVPVWEDGVEKKQTGELLENETKIVIPNYMSFSTKAEQRAWLTFKDGKPWYIRLMGSMERWVKFEHVHDVEKPKKKPVRRKRKTTAASRKRTSTAAENKS